MKGILEVENISLSYENELIIENLNASFLEGKITTIIGPNGCGKSTLLKGISRLLKKQKGYIYLNQADMAKLPTKEIAKQMAYLPQSATAPEDVTVREVVELGRYPYRELFKRVAQKEQILVTEVLEQTGLLPFENESIHSLSGGQRQRVWIAMALAQKTKIILLDEPTTYLDLGHQIEILKLLKELNETKKLTIIMVLHDLNLASRFSDYMIGMKEGKICVQGAPQAVMTKEVLRELFSIEAVMSEDPIDHKPICIRFD